MESALREIRMALLEADVNFRVVKQLIENIKEKAMGEEVLAALSPSQQVIKIVKEELIKILGSHESKLRFANEPPSVLHDRRPAGIRQDHLDRQAGALAFAERPPPDAGLGGRLPSGRARAAEGDRARRSASRSTKARREETQPLDLARSARREAANSGRDVLLVDTAGRLHIDDELMTRAAAVERAAQSGRDSVRGGRHDRAGRGEIGRRIPQAARHHRRHPDQDGWRCPRRRGAFDPPRHRAAA